MPMARRLRRTAQVDHFAPPQHLAGVALDHAGHDFHERGFAGAVLAEQQMHFAGVHREIAVAQRRYAAESLLDVPEFEEHRTD